MLGHFIRRLKTTLEQGKGKKNLFTFIGEGCAGVWLNLVAKQKIYFLVNVYDKCEFQANIYIWKVILMSFRSFVSGLWCVAGDVNSTRRVEEKR